MAIKKAKRDKFFKIRLLPSEVIELKELAKSENLDPSKFARSMIFSKNRRAAQVLWGNSDGKDKQKRETSLIKMFD